LILLDREEIVLLTIRLKRRCPCEDPKLSSKLVIEILQKVLDTNYKVRSTLVVYEILKKQKPKRSHTRLWQMQ
jgi:hypothetical protein